MEIKSGNHAQLKRFLGHHDRIKRTPMIWGTFAIGKSAVVYQYGMKKADDLKRKFVVWHQLTKDERHELYVSQEAREKVYVLYDNRAASNDSTDDKGIPSITNPEYLCWIQNQAYNVFSLPGTIGLLFNDELTLAPTLVQNSMYKMVLDRAVGDLAFNDDIFIVCAGNRVEDQAFVQTTPMPLKTRMGHFQLNPADPDDQIEYYINNGFDPRLIAFFKAHEELIFHWNEDSEEVTASTPRTTELCSDAIKPLDFDDPIEGEDIHFLACGWLSTYVGDMFIKFLQVTSKIDLDAIIKNPKKASELTTVDQQYGLVTLLVSRFIKAKSPEKLFGSILDIYKNVPEELGILMLRMMIQTDKKRFKSCVVAHPRALDVFSDISPFILKED